jgi:outer membrane protein OmpA-like peptidoglycan-associated protein
MNSFFLGLSFSFVLAGQGLSPLSTLAPDQPGCVDSKFFPKPLACRIDNCEKKESDRRDIPVAESEGGDPVNASMEGASRSLMYECWTGTTPASIVEKAEAALKAAGFDVPYRYADAEATLTARKDDLWITVDAASRFYTLTEMNAAPPDFESATDADSMAEVLDRFGRVPLAVPFIPGRPEIMPPAVKILQEVAALLRDHPDWRMRVETHTDGVGSQTANLNLSFFRATTVVNWLVANGIKRSRLEPKGLGDTRPVGDNTTAAGRARNQRLELVKISGQAGQ